MKTEPSTGMWDLDGWTPVPCRRADDILAANKVTVLSARTDDELFYREWGDTNETPILRDYRWTAPDKPCEHYEPAPMSDGGAR